MSFINAYIQCVVIVNVVAGYGFLFLLCMLIWQGLRQLVSTSLEDES